MRKTKLPLLSASLFFLSSSCGSIAIAAETKGIWGTDGAGKTIDAPVTKQNTKVEVKKPEPVEQSPEAMKQKIENQQPPLPGNPE